MGNKYDHHHHHHTIHHLHHKPNIFLPMLCRFSLKDIAIFKLNPKHPISGAAADPSSPKVTCMGQVKRNHRVTAAGNHHFRYSKLKKLFSSKTLLPPPTGGGAAAAVSTRSKSCRRLKIKNDQCEGDESTCVYDHKVVVNVDEIDPPLPVVKKAAAAAAEVNLWKRRSFNGAALKGLEIGGQIGNLTCTQ